MNMKLLALKDSVVAEMLNFKNLLVVETTSGDFNKQDNRKDWERQNRQADQDKPSVRAQHMGLGK